MSTDVAPAATSPLLGVPGAVAGEGAEAGVAAHYGEPSREQRALERGLAVVDLSNRGVLTVTGPDRLTWLDSLMSQRLSTLEPGESAEALLLDPSGRIEHAAAVLDDGATTWLVLEAAEAPALLTFLDRMRFMLRVEVADRTPDVAVLGAFDGAAGDAVESLIGTSGLSPMPLIWRDPWQHGSVGGATAVRGAHPAADWSWRLLLVPRTALTALADAAASGRLTLAGVLAAEALRIAAWRPRRAREVDERSIPQELDWLRSAVHLSKGCYRGQETVAKVYNLGRPPRRLVQLDLDGSEALLPAPGDAVQLGDASVGTVTSSGIHYEQGPIALAVVRRATPGDAALVVVTADGPVAAAQRTIVPGDAGPAVDVPRLPRLGQVTRPGQ